MSGFEFLAEPVRRVLRETGISEPTPPQVDASPLIAKGENVLIVAPTGSGKTEAAILPLLSRLLVEGRGEGISLLYITPLRALNRDMLRRLEFWCTRLGLKIDIRHGDTPQSQRQRQSRNPPDVLVTTPETLQAILPGRRMRQHLQSLKSVVVDELHNLYESKRGVQLCVGLERLRRIAGEFQLVALSATVGSPEQSAEFLFGKRVHRVVKAVVPKEFKYAIEYPIPDAEDATLSKEVYTSVDFAARLSTINEQLESHRSALIFVNSRTVAEMLGEKLSRMRPGIGVHHGSLPREERERVEKAFKSGELKALVCIPEDEFVVTSKGVKQAKDVSAGDEILSQNLQAMSTTFRPVVRKYERVANGFLQIRHELGTLRITPNHPVLCLGPTGLTWKPAGELQEGDAMVTVGKMQGKRVPTHQIIKYPNLFVKNSAVRALGYEPPGRTRSKVSRFNVLKSIMSETDLAKITEFNTTQATYKLPAWIDARLGYLLGFLKSDGDRHMRFFNSDPHKLARVQGLLSQVYSGTPYQGLNSNSGFPTNNSRLVLQAHSKPLSDLFANMWNILPLQREVVAAILAAYLDGDGCIVVRDGTRVEQVQFVTFNPANREYLIYSLLTLGFKPKLWIVNGASGAGFCISVVHNDEKKRLLALVKNLSFKASRLYASNLGNKPTTYYGLGSYIRERRKQRGISSYRLWREMRYSTRYENQKRGITNEVLARLNAYLCSPLLECLMLGKFGLSQVRSISTVTKETNVVNFEVEGTQNYAVTGVITHNCTSTLELGIDIGSVDLVMLYMSPRQVTSLIQRVGRSGHSLGRVSEGMVIAVSADDVLESAACIMEALRGNLEKTTPYVRSLDVLAHQVAGYLMDCESLEGPEMLEELRKAFPYWSLEEDAFWRVVRYLSELRKLSVDGSRITRTRATREYYFENLSMIPDETRYLVVDVATNQTVGILGEEFVLLKARVGLHFILKGKIWQIEKISDDKKVYVTPVEDPLAAVPGWDGEMLPIPFTLAQKTGELRRMAEGAIRESGKDEAIQWAQTQLPATHTAVRLVVDELDEHLRRGAPVPTDKLVLLEGFHKFLIIHACFGEAVNRTLGYVFEELLSRKGLIQRWWMDAYRIAIELTVDTGEIDLRQVSSQFFGLSGEELERTYAVAAQRNFPFPGRVKTIAERFGAIKRGKYISHPNLCSLPTRFENTPIFEEALQETGRDLLDMERVKTILAEAARGSIRVDVFKSEETPTPIGYHILYRYLDVPELVAPDSLARSTVQKMKMSIYATSVELVCMKCGNRERPAMIGELSEEPTCSSCRSGLLAPTFWRAEGLATLVAKKLGHLTVSEDEGRELAKARRSADLVLSYGKRAVIAQAVYGIGPQTASRVLAKMIEDEDGFYKSLLEAKLQFISTRPFW